MFEKFSTRLFIRINRVMGPVHRQVLLDPSKDFGDAGKGESMKLNLKKIGAIVAGATILASSVAFAGVMYGNTVLVNDNGQPLAKVIVGEKAAASDGVGAAKIVAKLANNAYAAKTLKASATATCTGGAGTGTCDVSQETTTLEVTIPGLGTGVHDFGLLIADFMDKEVQNRVNTDVWDDLSDLRAADANLFADQDDDLFLSGVDGTDGDFYKIYGDNFVRFAKTSVLTGTGRGGNWDQVQYAWFVGDSAMDDDKNNVVNVEIFGGGYSLVFGPSDYGLPLCPGDEKKPYLTCPSSSLIEAYRMQIDFLGDKWVISEVDIPQQSSQSSQITAKSDEKVYGLNGALVKLAKEATYGIIDVGDCLTWEAKGVKVCLDDISTEECYGNLPCKPAIVSFTDLNGKIITTPQGDPVKDTIGQGQTRKIYV
ncbi:MAG: S-layer protein, partial [Candidatus Anstonellales archaeon]